MKVRANSRKGRNPLVRPQHAEIARRKTEFQVFFLGRHMGEVMMFYGLRRFVAFCWWALLVANGWAQNYLRACGLVCRIHFPGPARYNFAGNQSTGVEGRKGLLRQGSDGQRTCRPLR